MLEDLNDLENSSAVTPQLLPELKPIVCRSISEINECLRLRYDEYCLNRSWEDADSFPEGLEQDEYDEDAVHVLLQNRSSGAPVGTVRVILKHPVSPEDRSIPSFQWSDGFRDHVTGHYASRKMMELSRFTISRTKCQSVNRSDLAKGIFPALALIKGFLRATAKDKVEVVVFTTTLSLKRMLEKSGFFFHDLGIRLEHRGTRAPLYREIKPLLADLHKHNKEIWTYVTDNGQTWPLDTESPELETRRLCQA
ncbi:MAG: GNAT family N-acyltransferase [Roseibium sp.]